MHPVIDTRDHIQYERGGALQSTRTRAEPGARLTGRMRELCRTFPNQSEARVSGIHFIQED